MTRRKATNRTEAAPASLEEIPDWWLELLTLSAASPLVDPQRAIFTNRTLRLDKVRAVGFDFDHTLGIYKCAELDRLAMGLVIERLRADDLIDDEFESRIPEAEFASKGLAVDIELGNVIKIDRFGHVHRAYHGNRRLSTNEKRRVYGEHDVIPHVTHGKRFIQVDSAFAKPELLIFAALAPRVVEGQGSCKKLWQTIRDHTDMVHRDGSLKRVLMERPLDFLEPDLDTVAMLERLRQAGKTVFLLTNSEWEYTRRMIGPALGFDVGGDDSEWLDLFDFVVVEARKPAYFHTGRNGKGDDILDGKVIRGGNIADIETRLGCSGPEVLYVGDHIYADLISSKRTNHWRTMLIISELEDEMQAHAGLPGMAEQLKQTDERRTRTERDVMHWKSIEAILDRLDEANQSDVLRRLREKCIQQRKRASAALKRYIRERERLRNVISDAVNPYWGSLFRTGSELTYYGKQLEDFACTYTSRATNIALYPTDHYFRSAMDYLPHELESM